MRLASLFVLALGFAGVLAAPACVLVPEPAEAATVAGAFSDRIALTETATSPLGSAFTPSRADIIAEWTPAERTYAAGTSTGQIEDLVATSGTVTSGAPVTIDLSGSSNPSPLASNPAMTVLQFLQIENCNTTGSVVLNVTATAPILASSDVLKVGPNQKVIIATKATADGYTIGAGSTDTIVLDASSSTACYRVLAAGHH